MANFSIHQRVQSFKYAFQGLQHLWKKEHNSRIHLLLGLTATGLGRFFQISRLEWITLIGCIGFVISTEIFNTTIEKTLDFMTLENHKSIKIIKDLSAAAVLISAMTSLIIGILIFYPKLIELWN